MSDSLQPQGPHGALEAPLSMELSREEFWRGSPCPPPRDFSNPGIEPASPVTPALQANYLPLSHQGSPTTLYGIFAFFAIAAVVI